MLALISHEMRTPLNGILGFIELIRPALEDPETVVFLDHVENSARRLERSTRKALDFSSLSTGKRAIHRGVLPHQVDAPGRSGPGERPFGEIGVLAGSVGGA